MRYAGFIRTRGTVALQVSIDDLHHIRHIQELPVDLMLPIAGLNSVYRFCPYRACTQMMTCNPHCPEARKSFHLVRQPF